MDSKEDKTTLTKLIDKIHDIIVNTKWENHVYLTGSCLRKSMLGEDITSAELVIDIPDMSVAFSRWIMQVSNNYAFDVNPNIDYTLSKSSFMFSNDDDLKNVLITCKTTRKNLYCDGCLRSSLNNFGTVQEEYKQRDVTINAFYYNISSKTLLDVEGKSTIDLKNRVLKCPSNPTLLIKEDPLKILRIIRLSATTGFGIDKDTWIAMLEHAPRIVNVPKHERNKEINKILLSPKPSIILRKMLCCNNILSYVFTGVDELKEYDVSTFPNLNAFTYTMKALDISKPILENRLAVLFHGIGVLTADSYRSPSFASEGSQMAELILKDMSYGQYLIDKVSIAVLMQKSFKRLKDKELPSNKTLREFVNLCGENLNLVLDTIDSLQKSCYPIERPNLITLIREKISKLKEKDLKHMHINLPINGKDVVNEFKLKPGALVGELMAKLRKEYAKRKSEMSRGECLDYINSVLVTSHS